MPRRFPWKAAAVGGVILGAVTLAVAAARRKPTPPTTRRVALVGDSYAVGLGPELAKYFPDFKYEGHVGTTTGQWARHAQACDKCGDWLTAFKPDVVLVSLGVNDGANMSPTYYQTIVKGIQTLGARVVWIEPPASVQTIARDVISTLGVQTIPGTHTPLSGDGLHPVTYASWAAEIAEAIRG